MVGKTISHYRVIEKLGSGGMGVVYKAEDMKLGRMVALKVLPPERVADPNRRRRFIQEARAASALNHPNIITIHDIDEAEGVHFIAMEYVAGKTLDRLMAGRGLRLNEALKYAVQMAAALTKAHSAGIVHRDLKPTNVMVTDDGLVKVLDFGLAKLTEAVPTGEAETVATVGPVTEEGTVVGTVGYMSPEQAEGKPVDARSDIFSFGSVLYEMLTGQRAFRGETKASTIAAILREEPKPLSQVVEGLPREVERLVKRCLRKDPAHRVQHMDDLKVALEELKEESDSGGLAEAPLVGAVPRLRERAQEGSLPRRGRVPLPYIAGGILATLAVVLALAVGLNVAKLRDRLLGVAAPPRIESLAVLPLENLSRDPEQEYFADGMTDALIAELGQIGSLRVISRTSAMRYKKTDKPLPQIARELNVDALIEGSVLRSGDRVRVTAQLIGAVPERHLWARSYERDLRDVLTLQSEVAQAIANEIRIKVTPQVQARLARARPVSPEAHEAYLKGLYYRNLRTEDGLKKSIDSLQQAIEKDPGYALAYVGLADSYSVLTSWGLMAPREAYPRAKAAALKALELDETLAEAHASLGVVSNEYDWDWVGAEKEFKRAIELNPGYAFARHAYAEYLSQMGRHNEAIAEIKRAQELDPLSLAINAIVGYVFFHARRYDEAIAQYRSTLELNAGFYPAHLFLGWAYEQQKLYDEAISEYRKAIALEQGSPRVAAYLALGYAAAGKRTEALKIISNLRQLSKQRYVSPYGIAQVYTALGDFDQAFAWLEKAYEERPYELLYLKVDPRNDPLRSDPRFQDLLRRMNFPP
jgi:serine/threonine-protein kinase